MTRHCFIGLAFLFSLAVARADLVMEQQLEDTNGAVPAVLKLHADKMRLDEQDNKGNGFSVIIDLNTRDSYTLLPRIKSFKKRSGAEIRRQMAAEKEAGNSSELNLPPAPAVDTGRAERVAGYDAEIYTWSGAHGVSETLWVATNFPSFEAIKPELAKIDEFNRTGPHQNSQPELSRLPGMVVKVQATVSGKKPSIITLVSAKLDPLDASLFELPADYVPWKPSGLPATNTPPPPTASP
jgi:hypothetical protein